MRPRFLQFLAEKDLFDPFIVKKTVIPGQWVIHGPEMTVLVICENLLRQKQYVTPESADQQRHTPAQMPKP